MGDQIKSRCTQVTNLEDLQRIFAQYAEENHITIDESNQHDYAIHQVIGFEDVTTNYSEITYFITDFKKENVTIYRSYNRHDPYIWAFQINFPIHDVLTNTYPILTFPIFYVNIAGKEIHNLTYSGEMIFYDGVTHVFGHPMRYPLFRIDFKDVFPNFES